MGIPPTTQATSRKTYLDLVSQFQQANPNITITPTDDQWDARTFATKLAGNTAPILLSVPMTEPQGLIARGQVADITNHAKQLQVFGSYDPRIIGMTSSGGKVYGLPYAAYSFGLAYNRDLFTKAGLDPNAPPTTWDEVEAAAKAIAGKTGVPGYAEMTTSNTGGWHLTAETYTRGGTMESPSGSTYVPAFDGEATKDALRLLGQMRWVDNSMGSNQLRGQTDVIKDFAAGNAGMFVSAPDIYTYTLYAKQYGGDPQKFGMGPMPQAGGNKTLLGGSVFMVNARATDAQIAAAIKWIDFKELTQLYDPAKAVADAKTKAADKSPVGLPKVQVFTSAVNSAVDTAVKPYVNVPAGNFAPYVAGDAKLGYAAEPPVAAQDLYAALDSAVQAVLTKQGTDIDAALADAKTKVAAVLKRSQ